MNRRLSLVGNNDRNFAILIASAEQDEELKIALISDRLYTNIDSSVNSALDRQSTERVTEGMNDSAKETGSKSTTSNAEEEIARKTETMANEFQREMGLRDKSLHRELAIREKAFRREHIAYEKALDARLGNIETSIASVVGEMRGFKLWMAGIGVAVVLGIMGANATIFSGGKAFFDGGKEALMNQQKIEQLILESRSQTEANKALLKEIQTKLESPPTKSN
jgi:hypothetical protein